MAGRKAFGWKDSQGNWVRQVLRKGESILESSIKSFVRARTRLSKLNRFLLNNSPTASFCKVEHFKALIAINQAIKILEIGFGDGENLISSAHNPTTLG